MKPSFAVFAIEFRAPIEFRALKLMVLVFCQALQASLFARRVIVSGAIVAETNLVISPILGSWAGELKTGAVRAGIPALRLAWCRLAPVV
jgi:hypothetical protein